MTRVALNKNRNTKMYANVLEWQTMEQIGFASKELADNPGIAYWYFSKPIAFPQESKWYDLDFDFDCWIKGDGSDARIETINVDLMEVYDFNWVLSNFPDDEIATIVKEQFNGYLSYLVNCNVICFG